MSIRFRLIAGASLVLAFFLIGAAFSLERAFTESSRSNRFAKLQSDVFLLIAATEIDQQGLLVMPSHLQDERFMLPGSGLYASVSNPKMNEEWQSASSIGKRVPYIRKLDPGQWRFKELTDGKQRYLNASCGVHWSEGKASVDLTFSVSEDVSDFQAELRGFRETLWAWLGGTALMLLIAQAALLGWGLAPLARVARELRDIEEGRQSAIEGKYPQELAGLTSGLNDLIEQERARQKRYKDTLADLAHSLKTPLAVLRGALQTPTDLEQTVDEQVQRMDKIVQHQLGRAAASGTATFAPKILLRPILVRITDSLAKVYRERQLSFTIACDPELMVRIDEGDAFETLGNLLDNAGKWAKGQIQVTAAFDSGHLRIEIEDDGPGIADPELVLQRGGRADEHVPGHGIGLTVVADIVAANGGTLTILHSQTLGGALIRLDFPTIRPPSQKLAGQLTRFDRPH
ncbi:histidine kinase [Burkholderiaceae bacterium DAT-1]|nr:histidine kinase [Burkholderiaceae bacterium DAT-1]